MRKLVSSALAITLALVGAFLILGFSLFGSWKLLWIGLTFCAIGGYWLKEDWTGP